MIERLHLEPTSRCTLVCSRCERTTLIEKFKKKRFDTVDVDIDQFVSFVDIPVKHIDLCGNLGDPIYHRDFIRLVKQIKQLGSYVSIFTNGSYKNTEWWEQLCSLLDCNDTVIFSIDGTPENFTKYRVNGDWKSIKQGIDVCVRSSVKTQWKYIVFSYNENDTEYCRSLSKQYGFDEFKVQYSDRWNQDNDWLKPSGTTSLGSQSEFKQIYKNNVNVSTTIDPDCKNNSQHYVTSKGFYAPCCHSAHYNFYYKSEWYKERNSFNISKTTLSSCVEYFEDFY